MKASSKHAHTSPVAQPRPSAPPDPPTQPVQLGRPPTYADVEALPVHLRGEIVGGQLYALPRPAPPHGYVISKLLTWLNRHFDDSGRGGGDARRWVFLPEPELHLEAEERPIVPDVAGWRRERMPGVPRTPSIRLAPDWVCEVLSPSTEAYDRGPKMDTYGRAGVPHAWLVDPEAHTLEAYRNDAGTWRPLGRWQGAARVRVAPFDAAELDLAELWA